MRNASQNMNTFSHYALRATRYLILATALVSLNIFAAEPDSVRDGYRHFIMPSGKPIQGGYLGFWELAFIQAGYGFGDFLSLSAGFTALPTVAFRSQIGFAQSKLTFFDEQGLSLSAGLNFLRLTSDNSFLHGFGVLTFETPTKTRVSGLLFYKLSTSTPNGPDNPLIIVDVIPYGQFSFIYNEGLGGGVGFDTPLPSNPNVRLVGEIWSHDLSTPNKLGVLGAVRIESENFSSDFGLMYFTLPLLAPVANFVWRF
jgi:hypothetical protein